MLIRKNAILLLLFALHAGADVLKTNEIPVVPAEDLVPPPEDQESILVRYSQNEQPSKSFFQRVVTWFGFNGNQPPNSKNGKKPPPKQQSQKQNGYVYENPAKPFSAPPQPFQQPPGYNYDDPTNVAYQNGFKYDPTPLKLQQQPQTGYTYEPPPQKLQQQPETGYTYDPPPVKLQQVPQTGYTYNPPPVKLQQPPQTEFTYGAPPVKLQQQPPTGYSYDPPPVKLQQPSPTGFSYDPQPVKLQQLPQTEFTYGPPPVKLQQQPSTGYTYNTPPVKLQQPSPTGFSFDPAPSKLQPQSQSGYTYNQPPLKLQQATGYTYNPPPLKLQELPKPQPTGFHFNPPPQKLQQRPVSLNDLVSSAASPTAIYSYNLPSQFSQAQVSEFPCNKIPWLPIFPNAEELNMLRAKLQAKNPGLFNSQPGYQNIQPIAKVQPEKFTQQLNGHTYLPPRNLRPTRQPYAATPNQINSINSINSLPLQSTAHPFKAPTATVSTVNLPSQRYALPVETTQRNLVPMPEQPLYDPKPFTAKDAQENGIYINGKLVTPTGLSTTSVQSLQVINQNHPVTQSQRIVQPTSSYGAPAVTYGAPPVTYGPPTNTYGTPPIKLTAEVTESSVYSRFKSSQPFTARPTLSSADQAQMNTNLMEKPIMISDSAADASEATRPESDSNTISDENQPILQILQELNVSTTPQTFHYAMSTEPTLSLSSASQIKKKENEKKYADRETPLDLLDTPISHFRKTSIGPSATINPSERTPQFKFIRNTWKPMPPNPFANPSVVTTATPHIYSSPVTPSSASAAFQSHTVHDANAIDNAQDDSKRTKKIQIIIPYTSKSRPHPFKNTAELQSFESSAGWSNSQHNDDHNSEESQVISSATPSPKSIASAKRNNSRYLTKILAKNIRELLKREHLKNISTIDLDKLQKNIDGWTEQEFSMSPNRASTISLLAQPKHIPFEYLTTTQSIKDLATTEFIQQTTEYPTSLFELSDSTEVDDGQDEGEVMDDESEDEIENENEHENENEIHGQENIAPDEQEAIQQAEEIEDEDFKRLDYLKALENNQVSGSEQRIFYATNPPPTVKTTTPIPPCSMTTVRDHESVVRTTVLPSADELWNKLKSLLSPSTNRDQEKVYIVTPQPYPYFESEKIVSDDDNEVVGKFKSPRFLVRPTPGSATGRSSSSFARLTFKPRADRLQTTTVKTTWNDLATDPVAEIFRSSTHSHSVVNGHAHAQAYSYVTPHSIDDDGQDLQVEDEDDVLVESETHRRSLHEYKH